MLILAGKSCSGKNAVADELKSRGYVQCVTYTSRPPRKDEIDGITYHFISDSQFDKLRNEGFFIEYICYDTVDGKWWYGTAKKDFENCDDEKFIILNPAGVKRIKEMGFPVKVVYIYANNRTIAQRLKNRKDNSDEAQRRMKADTEDFHGFENVANKIFYNNIGANIQEIADKIEKYVKGV